MKLKISKSFSFLSLRNASLLILLSMTFLFYACDNENIESQQIEVNEVNNLITPYTFDWETEPKMPTPDGQTEIDLPWTGAGAITDIYSSDVAFDYKKSDGWELVYNTFDPNVPGPIQNPYFVLYNKYRGLWRTYFYITTDDFVASTYMENILKLVTNINSTLLNFTGTDLVDPSSYRESHSQIIPNTLSTNHWYMVQNEFAYDPQIKNTNYSDILLYKEAFYYNVNQISLGGDLVGTVKGTIGSSSSSGIGSLLGTAAQITGTGVLSAIGADFLSDNGSATSGVNQLGLSTSNFKNISKGVNDALSSAASDLPGAIMNIFSGIFGGNSSTQTVSLNLNAAITLTGTETSSGEIPIAGQMLTPGSIIPSVFQGYEPLYNKSLGLFNLTGKPTITHQKTVLIHNSGGGLGGFDDPSYEIIHQYNKNNSEINSLVVWNDDVINSESDGASIENFTSEVVIINPITAGAYTLGQIENIGNFRALTGDYTRIIYYNIAELPIENNFCAVRISFNVVPNNGGPVSTIVKTFLANVVEG